MEQTTDTTDSPRSLGEYTYSRTDRFDNHTSLNRFMEFNRHQQTVKKSGFENFVCCYYHRPRQKDQPITLRGLPGRVEPSQAKQPDGRRCQHRYFYEV